MMDHIIKQILLAVLIPTICLAGITWNGTDNVVEIDGVEVSEWNGLTVNSGTPTPDFAWDMTSDSGTTVVATIGGVNGTLQGAADSYVDGINLGTGYKMFVTGSAVTANAQTVGFTAQCDFRSISADPPNGSSVYIFNTGDFIGIRLNFGATDNITAYVNSVSGGNISSFNLDDDNWHTVRVVYNHSAATLSVYWGADENNLTLFHTWTSVGTPSIPTNFGFGDDWNGWIRYAKIWNSVVTP